jgi:hypothetical protein
MLTQTEANTLIAMEKTFVHPATISMPAGTDQTHELISPDKRERFLLDLWRGMFRLSKFKYQTRGRKVIVLVRLDIDGAPHTNPDGTKLNGTHIHLYRQGFEDKWASPLDPGQFANPADIERTLGDFCRYCNIQDVPQFQGELL